MRRAGIPASSDCSQRQPSRNAARERHTPGEVWLARKPCPHNPGGRVNHIRRTAAIAVASGVAVASLVAPAAAKTPAPAPATTPAAKAAVYLANHLVGKHHNHFTGSYDDGMGHTITYVNYGETADAILSMDAAGVAQKAAARATSYLENH